MSTLSSSHVYTCTSFPLFAVVKTTFHYPQSKRILSIYKPKLISPTHSPSSFMQPIHTAQRLNWTSPGDKFRIVARAAGEKSAFYANMLRHSLLLTHPACTRSFYSAFWEDPDGGWTAGLSPRAWGRRFC